MFDHVKFGVSDFALSKAFFLNALAPLGVKIVAEGEPDYGVELCPSRRFAITRQAGFFLLKQLIINK